MSHFSPPINRYRNPTQQETELAAKSTLDHGAFEDPVATTVPVGWKGKSTKKQEYASSTENEEFWKKFSFEKHGLVADPTNTLSLGAGLAPADNRVDHSKIPDGRLPGSTTKSGLELDQDDPDLLTYQSSTDLLRAYHTKNEELLRARIRAAIDTMPQDKKKTLEMCEVVRQERWAVDLETMLKGKSKTGTSSRHHITGEQFQFPVEFPVGRAIDEQNNNAVNLRLYTECIKYGGVRMTIPAAAHLPPDIKELIKLLNQSLPTAVEIGGTSD